MNWYMNELAKLDRVRTELAQAKDLKSILAIRDKAEAVRTYAKAANLGRDIQNDAAEVKIEAECKAGELLKQMAEKGERTTKQTAAIKSHDAIRLDDLGIKPDQSSRWQKMAKVPKAVRTEYVTAMKIEGEATSAGVLKIERTCRQKKSARPKLKLSANLKPHPPSPTPMR